MTTYDCEITETRGKSWASPGTSTYDYTYDGGVNMNGYSDSMVDSTRTWKCDERK